MCSSTETTCHARQPVYEHRAGLPPLPCVRGYVKAYTSVQLTDEHMGMCLLLVCPWHDGFLEISRPSRMVCGVHIWSGRACSWSLRYSEILKEESFCP